METKEVLKVNRACKTYNKGKVWHNHEISFSINDGEVVGFLGMNGAGKTTMLKSICGLHTFDEGSIEICGHDVRQDPLNAKRNFGFVPDNHVTFEKLTGREYVNFSADAYGVNMEDRTRLIEKYLNLFNLEAAFDRQIKGYSHGMKQKVALMASFIHNPKLWVLDEPLVGLDVDSQQEVLSLLQNASTEGNSVFFSSHNLDIVQRICHRAIIIHNGRMIKEIDVIEFNKKAKHTLEDEFRSLVAKAKNGEEI
ncbi:MAG: ABC transporter ATP-binding protein [Firmicutes bacterium]|nr:ABC transporter ATP-binding protein [Bacillota bacterium]